MHVYEYFICPVCGETVYENVYRDNATGEVIGCDECAGGYDSEDRHKVSIYAADLSDVLEKENVTC